MNKDNEELRRYSGMLFGGIKGLTILGIRSLGNGMVQIWGFLKSHPAIVFFVLLLISFFGNVYQVFHLHQEYAKGLILSDSMYDSMQRARARHWYDTGYKAAIQEMKVNKEIGVGYENGIQVEKPAAKPNGKPYTPKKRQTEQPKMQGEGNDIDRNVSEFEGKKYGGAKKEEKPAVEPKPAHHSEPQPTVVE